MATSSSTVDLKTEDSNSNLVVALRIRPLMEDEIYSGATPIAHKVDDNMVVIMDPADDLDDILRQNRSREKQYIFDVVLDAKSTQHNTYTKTCKFLIPSIIDGYNATVFAYGATGAGKTYTMLGRDDSPGIMAQALTDLFEKMNQSQERLTFKVSMSYLEIYNEMIRDLLNPNSGFLDLREDQSSGLQVAGLSTHEVTNTLEVMDILKEGNKQRTQEPTAANKTSSRSHAVLFIHVRQRNRLAPGIHQQYRMGKLILIDLAGSERAANTQNRGKRMVEGAHINRSLLALGNCINALSDKSGSKYVNYRDSKLTRLLKDALGGNCKTVMVAHISPASFHFEESRNTLSYADRAKSIKTKVRQNILDMTLHISQYSNVITDLKEEIKRLKQKLDERSLNRNMTTMQAIQAEVLSQTDEQEVHRLKTELDEAHRGQMDYRQTLNELKNSQSEINLELTRQQRLVNSYKRMKNLNLHSSGDVLKELSSKNINKMVKELADLECERSKMESTKEAIECQLKSSIKRTAKIEEDMFHLPLNGSNGSQREIINLLAKVHHLELENLRMYEELTKQLDESRHRSLIIEFQLRQCSLADEIIQRQKEIIIAKNMPYPTDLQNLYVFFKKEMEELHEHQQKFNRPSHSRSFEEISSIAAPSTADNSNSNQSSKRMPLTFQEKSKKLESPRDDVSLFVADMNLSNLVDRRVPRDERSQLIKKKNQTSRKPQHLAPLTQSRLAEHNRCLERTPPPVTEFGSRHGDSSWAFKDRRYHANHNLDSVTDKSKVKRIYKQKIVKKKFEAKPSNCSLRFAKTSAKPSSPEMFVKGSTFRMK